MELTLVEVTIKGKPATEQEVRKYLANKKIELPEQLAREIIQREIKNSVPSNEVFSSNNI